MPPPSGVAGQFLGWMFVTKYLSFVFAIQLIGGVLLCGLATETEPGQQRCYDENDVFFNARV